MNIDIRNSKVRNAFVILGILGCILMLFPLQYESAKYQGCLERVGESRELCELPQYLNSEAVINPLYTKLAGVASMILGCLFLVAACGYFLTKFLKKEVSKMRNDVTANEPVKVKGASVKSLLEMKQLLDEKLITPEEFEAYKKTYLGKPQ